MDLGHLVDAQPGELVGDPPQSGGQRDGQRLMEAGGEGRLGGEKRLQTLAGDGVHCDVGSRDHVGARRHALDRRYLTDHLPGAQLVDGDAVLSQLDPDEALVDEGCELDLALMMSVEPESVVPLLHWEALTKRRAP